MEGFELWVLATSSRQWQSPHPGNKACATGMALGVVAAGLSASCQGNYSSKVKPAPSQEPGEATAKEKRRKSEEKQGRRKMEEEEEEKNSRRRTDTCSSPEYQAGGESCAGCKLG